MAGWEYRSNDTVGKPLGPIRKIDWANVRRFSPNPTLGDFLPAQCMEGWSWVGRNSSFFVSNMWLLHNRTLNTLITPTWQECARRCKNCINEDQPLQPCVMWSWIDGAYRDNLPPYSCLLAQGGAPEALQRAPGFVSGCQHSSGCNNRITVHPHCTEDGGCVSPPTPPPPPPVSSALLAKCAGTPQRGNRNHVHPQRARDPAHGDQRPTAPKQSTMGIGPPWEYDKAAPDYERRVRQGCAGLRAPWPILPLRCKPPRQDHARSRTGQAK